MNFIESVNAWIFANQALVVSVGIPLFTIFVTGWASFLSHRTKVSEVRLNGRMKLSEYRRQNFDELLHLSSRLQSIFAECATGLILGKEPVNEERHRPLLEAIECANKFLLRTQATEEQVSRFSKCVTLCTQNFLAGNKEVDTSSTLLVELREVCKEILDDEWQRIERELKDLS